MLVLGQGCVGLHFSRELIALLIPEGPDKYFYRFSLVDDHFCRSSDPFFATSTVKSESLTIPDQHFRKKCNCCVSRLLIKSLFFCDSCSLSFSAGILVFCTLSYVCDVHSLAIYHQGSGGGR